MCLQLTSCVQGESFSENIREISIEVSAIHFSLKQSELFLDAFLEIFRTAFPWNSYEGPLMFIKPNTEAYLGYGKKSTIKCFYENSSGLLTFSEKSSIIDVYSVLNTPLKKINVCKYIWKPILSADI